MKSTKVGCNKEMALAKHCFLHKYAIEFYIISSLLRRCRCRMQIKETKLNANKFSI